MLTYSRIKELCKANNVTITGLEKELGFARGSLCKVNTNKPSSERVQKIADYFKITVDELNGESCNSESYYLNSETAQIAQEMKDNRDLKALFDAARDASPEDLQTTYQMLLALKKKEKGE